jgi:hypothetical protein
MTSKNNGPETQELQDNSNAIERPARERIIDLANEFAKRAKKRQLRYDEGHNLFTK